ncbi:unnamed protein product [Lampetra planeri]
MPSALTLASKQQQQQNPSLRVSHMSYRVPPDHLWLGRVSSLSTSFLVAPLAAEESGESPESTQTPRQRGARVGYRTQALLAVKAHVLHKPPPNLQHVLRGMLTHSRPACRQHWQR